MKRRAFLQDLARVGMAAGAALSLGRPLRAWSQEKTPPPATPEATDWDLVAVRGGEPDAMFDRAMVAMGGMGKFVKKGQKVVVKPNIGWDSGPELAANTNPRLVGRIVAHCLEAGAKEVVVFDHTCDQWERTYAHSGIEAAVKEAGGKLAPAHTEGYYQEVQIPKGRKLTSTKVHEAILGCDVFINVPVLKHHGAGRLTIAMKNLMGVVWDRGFWHRNDLHQCIADFGLQRAPDLNIIDAYRILLEHGPRGGSVDYTAVRQQLLVAPNLVVADSAAAKLFGKDPAEIPYLANAEALGLGSTDLTGRRIHRIALT